jgi:hypothetical protein
LKQVYFACSIRGGRDDQAVYAEIVVGIKHHAIVLSELFADQNLTSAGHEALSEQEIWHRDLGWVKQADVVIAEVTNPSLGVGYEIAKAEEWGKPVLVLFRSSSGRKLSAMIAGSPVVQLVEYETADELEPVIQAFLTT